MSAEPDPVRLAEDLRAMIAEGRLPARAQGTAQTLLDRLGSPVRIALLGCPRAGKSTVANVLCGQRILPPDLRLPTCQIAHAETESLTVTTRDGTRQRIEGLDLPAAMRLNPLFIDVAAPLEPLRGLSLLEVVTDGSPRELAAASAWAARRTEMALWVTRNFAPAEQALWDAMPEKLQRHAFLVLNGLDGHEGDAARKLISANRADGRNRFLDVFPVSAGNAAAGLSPDGPAAPRTAGCGALLDGLTRRIALGRQADMDTAQLFLQRFGGGALLATPPVSRDVRAPAPVPATPAATAPRQPDPAPAAPAAPAPPEPVAHPADPARPASETLPAAAPAPLALSRLGALGAAPTAPVATEASDAADADSHAQALGLLASNAQIWLQALEDPAGWDSDRTLRDFCETADRLEGLLPATSPLQETLHQLSDYLLLLQVEQDQSACVDGAAALLQVRRDLEAMAAA